MMDATEWNPGKLLEASGYYWRTCTLHAGVRLGIFTHLDDGSLPAADLARAIGADAGALDRLLNALAAMGLLVKSGESYSNTPAAQTYLSQASPGYIGHMILHHQNLVESWAQLDASVRTGQQVRHRSSGGNPENRENFLMGMFNNAMLMAPRVVGAVDLPDCRKFLDLGGGPGTYAIHFCLANPDLNATVFDLSTTRPFAEKTIARFDLSDRIAFQDGDYLTDEIIGTYDAAWLSHILHAEGPEGCRTILRKAVSALKKGGRIIVHDFFLEETRDRPLFPALFSLNMLLGTESGRSYTEREVLEMLAEAGVTALRRLPFKGPTESGLITGTV
jgi:SAM-dependent methyltransferase